MRYGDTLAYQIFQERQEKAGRKPEACWPERLEQVFQLFSQQTHLPMMLPSKAVSGGMATGSACF